MGELRAYRVLVSDLRALLRDPARRGLVAELARPRLAPPHRPEPFGPIYTRVPGAPVVRAGDPTPADLDTLLGGAAVPPTRAPATWRLVEAVVAATSTADVAVTAERPAGLAPLGLAVPGVDGLEVGSWDLAQAAAQPALRSWAGAESRPGAAGSDQPDVVVFWEAHAGR